MPPTQARWLLLLQCFPNLPNRFRLHLNAMLTLHKFHLWRNPSRLQFHFAPVVVQSAEPRCRQPETECCDQWWSPMSYLESPKQCCLALPEWTGLSRSLRALGVHLLQRAGCRIVFQAPTYPVRLDRYDRQVHATRRLSVRDPTLYTKTHPEVPKQGACRQLLGKPDVQCR